ncbi:MAG: class I SAM-dependent methyltransferase [Oscillospiraceae bacterium]|nr:class I SAM-dependent methyltransferase [Oscillospiraceae bacterium]
MKLNKQSVVAVARKLHLLPLLEKLRLLQKILKVHKENREYLKGRAKQSYPPYSLMYDAYSHCSFDRYDKSGLRDAKMITRIIRKYVSGDQLVVCEFGCGPARIVRHLRSADAGIAKLIGTDYNAKTIRWCKAAVPEIVFIQNELAPPFDLPDHSLDVLYCVSVFTHLSEEMHFEWIREIRRVLKPGGLFIGTFHGEKSFNRLLPYEQARYLRGELVSRGNVKEGSRIYTAYQSDKFLSEKLLADFDFIEKQDLKFSQSIWAAR